MAIFWITSLALASLAASGQATPSPTFEGISERAAAVLKANQLEEGVRLYRQAVGMHPGWSEGWGYLGRNAVGSGVRKPAQNRPRGNLVNIRLLDFRLSR